MSLLTLTDKAKDAIINMLDNTQNNPIGVRLSIQTKGCSGLSWNFEIARDFYENDDTLKLNSKYILFIDKKSALFIIGSKLDYIETELESGFVFTNPNEKGRCGCGESFYV